MLLVSPEQPGEEILLLLRLGGLLLLSNRRLRGRVFSYRTLLLHSRLALLGLRGSFRDLATFTLVLLFVVGQSLLKGEVLDLCVALGA